MSQTAELISSLKSVLKEHGKSYKDVAQMLGVSEGSVKRTFADQSFTLDRIDKICAYLGLELSDLVQIMMNRSQAISELSLEQEKALVSDEKLLLLGSLLVGNWRFQDICLAYQFEKNELTQLLARLDRMKLIDLLPNNRVRGKLSRNFSWIPNGPIQKYFDEHLQGDFLKSSFTGLGERKTFVNGMLSKKSIEILEKNTRKLEKEFHELCRGDEQLSFESKFGVHMLVAYRPVSLDAFEKYKRPDFKKVLR